MKSKKQSVRKSNKDVKKTARSSPKSAAEKSRIRVLIVDDHSVVREGLVSLISHKADMTVVGEAANGREGVELWKALA